ncbi:UBP12, partial [Symbiodinium necroappetens]
VVRGFANLEETLDQYFSPKVIEDGSGLRVRTTRKFKRMPSVLQWYLKRGDYDCCTGLSGLTETFMRFPRQIDMGKYAEGGAVYHLYAIMVECDDHYLSYIRPEMEGDRGQWYRFDDREAGSAVCGVSNATAVDASFGGEEWLCVNYLYGPSAVLKRPRESRASMLLYLKDSELQQLLREPKLPKLCPELQMPLQRGEHLQAGSVELEAAAAAEAELLNDLHVEQLKEVKKKKAKQKKKQKEKERKHQVRPGEESGGFEPVRDEREEDSEDDEEAPSEPPMEAPEKEVDSDEEGFEEVLRVARGKKRGSKSQSNCGALLAGQGEASGSRASSAGRAPPSQEEKNEENTAPGQRAPAAEPSEEAPLVEEPQEVEQARKKKGKQKKRKERERERRPQ